MNKIKATKGERIFRFFNLILLTGISVVCLYPILYCLWASLSNSNLLMAHEGMLWAPLGFNANAYYKVFENSMVLTGFKNTLLILVLGVGLNMVLTILGAYFLARKNIYFKKPILVIFMITMFFNGGLIPTYLTVKSLGLDNTIWAIILPTAVSTYNMIIMRTGFAAVPESLAEAAKLDGANDFSVLLNVYLPLTKATLAVICLYYAVAHWNSWFQAAIYLNDRDKYPIQLVLREILITNDMTSMTGDTSFGDVQGVGLSIQYATIIVSTLPILIVYPFVQRYFVSGVMIGSVKG